MPLSDIVNVQITRQTQTVSEPGFGTLMILGTFKNWNDLIRKYDNMQQVAADFSPQQDVYIAAQDVFAQPITPPYIYIGRRTVDTVDIDVETAMSNQAYTVDINGTPTTINSTTSVMDSVLTLSGIDTWVITFPSSSITTGAIITPTINGTPLTPTNFVTNQTSTLAALVSSITGQVAGTSGSYTATAVTITFSASASSVINSVIVTGQASPPSAVLTQDGPLVASNSIAVSINGTPLTNSPYTYATSSLATLTTIVGDIITTLNTGYSPGIANAVISGPNNNVITVSSNPNQAGLITSFVVTAGASQATAAIVNSLQPTDANTIADALTTAINANATINQLVIASTPSTPNGTLSITVNYPTTPLGTPYTISVSTDIVSPTNCRVVITQAVPNQSYIVKISGTNFIYTAPSNVTTNEEIAAGLVALIVAGGPAVNATATDNFDGSFEVASTLTGGTLNIQVFPFEVMLIEKGLIIGPYVPSASIVADLIAIQNVNNDWYALAVTDRTVASVQAVAAWIETQVKIFGTASDDPNIINLPPGTGGGEDHTSIAYLLYNAGYARSFVMYHQDADSDYPECAWFGNVLPLTPGSETWKFKTLNSIPYSDLSTNEENNAFAKNTNTYEFIGGVGITQNGTMAAGEYIDIIRGVDWLTSTIQTYVYSILVLNPKVPYTDAGITAVESQILAALQLGITNNFLASEPPPLVSVPLAVNVPLVDKANRVLNNVSFTATLAGAIQAVNITGTVSV